MSGPSIASTRTPQTTPVIRVALGFRRAPSKKSAKVEPAARHWVHFGLVVPGQPADHRIELVPAATLLLDLREVKRVDRGQGHGEDPVSSRHDVQREKVRCVIPLGATSDVTL